MIVRNSDNVIIYDNKWSLTESGAIHKSGNKRDSKTTTENSTEYNIKVPSDFSGGDYYYINGEFSRTIQGLTNKLAAMISLKEDEIRNDYNEASLLPVTHDAIEWNGGFESSLAIDGVTRITENAGGSEVTIYDYHNVGHVLTLTQAKALASAIGISYQVAFATKQARMVALHAITIDTENMVSTIESV